MRPGSPRAHIERLREFDRAGFDRVVVQQVGVDQERLLHLYEDAVLPELSVVRSA